MKKVIAIPLIVILFLTSLGFLLYAFDQQVEAVRQSIMANQNAQLAKECEDLNAHLQYELDSLEEVNLKLMFDIQELKSDPQ